MAKRLYKKKKYILAAGLIILLVGAVLYYKMTNGLTTSAPQTEQQKLQEEEKDQAAKNKANNTKSPVTGKVGDTTSGPQSPTTPQASTLSKPTITRAEQEPGGDIVVTAILGNISSGTCTATFVNGQQAISRDTAVQQVTTYYACGEFRLKKSDFPATGDWTVTVKIANSAGSATSDPRKITIN